VKRRIFLIAISAVLLVTAGWGQDGHTVPASPLAPEMPYTEVLMPPLPVSGLQMPLTFSSENPRTNFVMGSLQLGSGYDDNVFATPSNHTGDVSYLILPSVDLGQTRERWNWDLGYSPGFVINQRVTERNQAAHNLHLLLGYRLTPHVALQVRENFEKTSNLFSGLLGSTPVAGPGPLQQPNVSAITPLADRTSNSTGLAVRYQFSASSMVGTSGNFYLVNYSASAGSTGQTSGLIDSRSWGGNAFYAYSFSNRQWTGVAYDFQRLLFNPGYRTDVNRALMFYSVSIGSQMTFSIWAGPEYTTSLVPDTLILTPPAIGITSFQSRWAVAGGGSVIWQGRRTSFRVGYTRQTTDGAGLAQAVRLRQLDGEIRERLTSRWTTSLDLGYARNYPLNPVNGLALFRSWLGNAGLDCRLTENLAFGLRYGRDQLTYQYPALAAASNRNRAWLSISYSFSRSLGR
jgi:hypothetical protein